MNVMKSTEKYKERIKAELNNTLTETTLERGKKRWKSSRPICSW